MICTSRNFIFSEVPKTGTTTILAALRTHIYDRQCHGGAVESFWYQSPLVKKHELHVRKHSDFTQIKTVLDNRPWSSRSEDLKFDDMFKFIWVRNPWDRVVSLYTRREGHTDHQTESWSFEKFVDWISLSTDTCNYPTPKKNQIDFAKINGKVVADFIGKMENIQEDFNTVCDHVNIPHITLGHHNKVEGKKHYTEYYNNTTRDIIADKFKVDIEYLGYSFGE